VNSNTQRSSRLLPDSRIRITVNGKSQIYRLWKLRSRQGGVHIGFVLAYMDWKRQLVKEYTIRYIQVGAQVKPVCDCPDAKHRNQHNCKHILAVQAYKELFDA
jgi:hypothetical protein